MLLTALEFLGLVAFAASGALAAVRARLDVFGVVVVGLTTALGGGIIRDVLLGIHPPTSLRNWPYLAVCAVTALVVFAFHPQVARLRHAVLLADAVGLGVFATAGTTLALNAGATGYAACLIGMTSGIGGGAVRDLLLREIPLVLRKEIYAMAALTGAVCVWAGHALNLPAGAVTTGSAVVVVAIRVLTLWRHWNAPVARPPEERSL
ncbi:MULTISPECIES: trimeric intracellular cation channel family protein [Amycolatopsis]|uniref:Trimeric intracellular cation channel family protein n=1 Tax=Amycolatopsis dendrobii TaxID=2760662 RepID=A0A7W3VTM9_9PSEU|nr:MULTISPECIES: trimeric intracellular cation channel family protein [Amycolatopsis]MBB1152432.1 trimeric intracellular cation channel family protein [Amycolatopsis dendrobii]UKD52324.1 trimeric intracellular cation channel family protein [Amycolatopsis sp. FU40]